MGPVQEKLTKLSVKAIRKMLRIPVVVSDFLSTALVNLLGRVISNPPRKLAPNTSNIRKKKILKTALVLSAFKALAPKHRVTSKPNATYITTIHTPYVTASRMPLLRSLLRFKKKLTVMGMMGHTQGVSNATNPPNIPKRKIPRRLVSLASAPSSSAFSSSITGAHKSPEKSSAAVSTFWTSAAKVSDSATCSSAFSSTFSCSAGAGSGSVIPAPSKLNSTFVGGIQFWSLHAP